MAVMAQAMTPGVVGISTYVDYVYLLEMQRSAVQEAGTDGPINQLRVITATLDFHRLVTNLHQDRIDEAEQQVAEAAETVAAGGADFLVVTSGTTSTLTGAAQERTSLPVLDLAEAAMAETGDVPVVGVLSTRRAAGGGIFQDAARRHGTRLLLPEPPRAAQLDDIIFGELVHGRVTAATVRVLREAVTELADAGAQRVILGNTDMSLALTQLRDTPVPVVDAAHAHARRSARVALHGPAAPWPT